MGNVVGGSIVRYINLPIEELKVGERTIHWLLVFTYAGGGEGGRDKKFTWYSRNRNILVKR